MKTTIFFASLALALGCTFLVRPTTALADNEWVKQLGTSSYDESWGVSADGLGNVYISGQTGGDLDGTNAGSSDAFLSKFDASGSLLWTEQLGTSGTEYSRSVSADGLGNVYISGTTFSDFTPESADAFLSKFDASGSLLWTEQLGTSTTDYSFGVSADGLGSVYISGYTYGDLDGTNAGEADAFVSKFHAGTGSLLWTEQLGTSSNDFSFGVSADGLGNVYISGTTSGILDGTSAGFQDAFVTKYDAGGTLLWTEQLGSINPASSDNSYGVSADGLGNVYISGHTQGDLGGAGLEKEAFVTKYDAGGTLLWTEQLGTINPEDSYDVSADGLGNVYISGSTQGDLGGPNAGGSDAWVSKYDDSGLLLWTEQLGSSSPDVSFGVSADGLGNVYISGYTNGSLGGPNAGDKDAFVAKYSSAFKSSTSIPVGSVIGNVVGGGSDNIGGFDALFDNVTSEGSLTSSYSELSPAEFDAIVEAIEMGASDINFALAGDNVQFWDISFDGEYSGFIDLTFGYDDSNLPFYIPEDELEIYHFEMGAWVVLQKIYQDLAANTITVRTSSFSPFVAGVDSSAIPEPTSLIMFGSLGLLCVRRRRRKV